MVWPTSLQAETRRRDDPLVGSGLKRGGSGRALGVTRLQSARGKAVPESLGVAARAQLGTAVTKSAASSEGVGVEQVGHPVGACSVRFPVRWGHSPEESRAVSVLCKSPCALGTVQRRRLVGRGQGCHRHRRRLLLRHRQAACVAARHGARLGEDVRCEGVGHPVGAQTGPAPQAENVHDIGPRRARGRVAAARECRRRAMRFDVFRPARAEDGTRGTMSCPYRHGTVRGHGAGDSLRGNTGRRV